MESSLKTAMTIFKLPEDIPMDDEKQAGAVIFYDYSAPVLSVNANCVLSMNAISLVLSGEKTMHFAEKRVDIKADKFHFLSSGNCLVSMKLNNTVAFKSILLFFDNAVLTNFYLKYHRTIEALKTGPVTPNEPYLAFKKDAFIVNYIASLQLMFQSNRPPSMEMKWLKFEELMLYLLETYPDQILAFQSTKTNEFDDFQLKKVVETNVGNPISVDELAFLCNVSASTFKRRFSRIYGSTPSRWLVQQRMNMARDLLHQPSEKPSDVFYKVGYENHSSFTQAFKQTFGITPKEFQQRQNRPVNSLTV
ncbi:helix-turn-helix domain-containing protein [Larkinella rosea]|uniref:AraC family transcriptional regulator n=1 Tax=Larkinella rosea TaxID=2025312 RepID=A0A3P1BNM0_9BACT|nr:AraC family transcriptional regulator [Larkinella rosea]RRB02672.1 AraC family transcriptional regulator [Larkinella rosea]